MQCYPRIIRGDHWCCNDWLAAAILLNGGVAPWNHFSNTIAPAFTYASWALAVNGLPFFPDGSRYAWTWFQHYDPTAGNPWVTILLQSFPAATWWRLTDMHSWPFGTAPFESTNLEAHALLVTDQSVWGQPWLNPI